MLPINGKDISHIPRDGAYPYGTIGSYIETGCNDDDRYIRRYTQSFYVFMSDRCCLLARINYSCYCFLITRLVTKNSPPSTPIRRPTICERLCSPCYHQMREKDPFNPDPVQYHTPFNIIPIGIKGPTTDWLTGEGPHRDTTVKTRSTGKLIFISRDSKIDKARYHLRQAASSIDQQAVRCGTASGVTNCGSLWYGFYASR